MKESLIQGNTEQQALTSFINLITLKNEKKISIDEMMKEVGLFFKADRSYVFEKDETGKYINNTFEWCNEGVTAEINNLQHISAEVILLWEDQFHKQGSFFLENNSDYAKKDPFAAAILEPQNIDCLMAAPITLEGEIVGLFGVDNPRNHKDMLMFLSVAAGSIYKEIIHKKESDLIHKLKVVRSDIDAINLTLQASGIGCWGLFGLEDDAPQMVANLEMLDLLGLKEGEKEPLEIFRHWRERIYPEDTSIFLKLLDDLKDKKQAEIVYRWNHPQKGEVYVRVNAVRSLTSSGKLLLTGILYDITENVQKERAEIEATTKALEEATRANNSLEKTKLELEQARNQAEAANKAKTSFFFNMSHDIRTPMNAIMGFTKLAERHKDNPEQVSDYLKKIQGSGEYLLSIINNVLDMARIESGKVKVDDNFMDLMCDQDNVINMFREEMNRKKISFSHTVDIEHRYVFMDQIKVQEIIVNILSNAVKYTPAGGSISLSVKEVPCKKDGFGTYQIVIKDTGIGMSKEFQSQIFESFSRERNSTESGVIGTGLGMAITKSLIDLMGGTIEVKSELGKGSEFIVTISHRLVDKPEEYLELQKNNLTEIYDFTGKRVLVAEDNELNAEIATVILVDCGFEVDVACDGVVCFDMLEKAASDYYDVILMDIQMPNMNGYMAAEKIRRMADKKKASIPILAMTANAFEEDKKDALAAGMNGHIAKPIDVSELMKTLTKVFNK